MVKFVSYDGKYPNLCRGNLIVNIDGEDVNMGKCLSSGGSAYFDSNYNNILKNGEWLVDVPKEYEKYADEITEVVNENVPHGCCGGCL